MNENNDSFDAPSDAEIDELLGAYVLDALSDEERTFVESHLEQNPLARDEADHLALAADWLADAVEPVSPSPDLWARISSQLDDAPASVPLVPDTPSPTRPSAPPVTAPPVTAPRVTAADAARPTDELARRRAAKKGWSPARVALSAAAAVVVIALIAVGGFALGDRDGSSTTDLAAQAQEVSEQPGSLVADLAGESGATARVVVSADGKAYFLGDGLPALEADQAYQLWSVVDGNAISVGVLGHDPDATMVSLGSQPGLLAVTVEPAEGSVVATTDPTVIGELA